MPTDYPREVIARMADDAIRRHGGPTLARVYFKFTCERCGERCMFQEPNSLYESGECERCGHTTQVDAAGFALHLGPLSKER